MHTVCDFNTRLGGDVCGLVGPVAALPVAVVALHLGVPLQLLHHLHLLHAEGGPQVPLVLVLHGVQAAVDAAVLAEGRVREEEEEEEAQLKEEKYFFDKF